MTGENQLSGSFVYINPEVYFTLRIRMFESITEQITDDFLYLVSIEYRIIRVG